MHDVTASDAWIEYFDMLESTADGDQVLIERCKKGRAEALGLPYEPPPVKLPWWKRVWHCA